MQWHLDLGGPGQSRVLAPASALASANAMQCCRVSWAININKGTYSRGHAAEFEGNGSPKMSQRKQCRMRGRVSILWIDNLRGMNNRTTHNSMTKYKSDFMKIIATVNVRILREFPLRKILRLKVIKYITPFLLLIILYHCDMWYVGKRWLVWAFWISFLILELLIDGFEPEYNIVQQHRRQFLKC